MSDPYRRRIRVLFLVSFPLLFAQFAFAKLVAEPYPSVVFPGFGIKGVHENGELIVPVTRLAFIRGGSVVERTGPEWSSRSPMKIYVLNRYLKRMKGASTAARTKMAGELSESLGVPCDRVRVSFAKMAFSTRDGTSRTATVTRAFESPCPASGGPDG